MVRVSTRLGWWAIALVPFPWGVVPVEGVNVQKTMPPGAGAAVKKIKLFSTAALIVGVLGLFFYLYVGFIGAAAIGAGVVALTLNKGYESRGLAIAGILLGAAGISMWAFSLYMFSSFC